MSASSFLRKPQLFKSENHGSNECLSMYLWKVFLPSNDRVYSA
jgi:hypothetical protein